MERKLTPQNWHHSLNNKFNVFSVKDDFLLVDINVKALPPFDFPFKMNRAICVICTNGRINLTPFEMQAPSVSISLPNQILQYDYVSEDFNGHIIVVSARLLDSFFSNMHHRVEMALHIMKNSCKAINNKELQVLLTYCNSAKDITVMNDNPYRFEMLKHLFLVLFYTFKYYGIQKNEAVTQQTLFVNKFLELVRENFKQERQIAFYAQKLCLTSKYLSLKIRDLTGKSANDWIDDYVMLEAKALLKSTNMTIQQIGDELNFSSQSFFGKYFKRCEGVSPKEYREK
jgi:AraC-like DNA-binding protein